MFKLFTFQFFVLWFFLSFSAVSAQVFNPQVLVSLPGENRNFEVKKFNEHKATAPAAICFENYYDSLYSICLKKIFPYSDTIQIIASDSIPKANPSLTWLSEDSIRIVWQQMVGDKWQIFSAVLGGDSLKTIKSLTNAAEDNISPQVSGNRLVWINDLYLTYAEIGDSLMNIKKIDGSDCANPDLSPYSPEILYEQTINENVRIIKKARYIANDDRWELVKLISKGNNKNPRFFSSPELYTQLYTYQKFDTLWKSYIKHFENNEIIWISANKDFNTENPAGFFYDLPTKSDVEQAFVVYVSDSLENNKEIILDYYINGSTLPDMNVSNMGGDDINPFVISIADSVCVFWEHYDKGTSQIYWAKEHLAPISKIAERELAKPQNFVLKQNYPNPFNPVTTIEFYIPNSAEVSLTVYNIRGEKIKTLIASELRRGQNKISWDGFNDSGIASASGIYFYVLNYENTALSKKMLLLR